MAAPSGSEQLSIIDQIEQRLTHTEPNKVSNETEDGDGDTPDEEEETEEASAASEGEDSEEASDDASDEDSEEAEGEDAPWTLSRLAESMEIEEAQLLQTLQVEGQDGTRVPLAQVLEAYTQGAPEQQAFQAARARVAELEGAEEQRNTKFGEAMGYMERVSLALLKDLELAQPIDPELRKEDPAEWQARTMERQQKEQRLREALEVQKRYKAHQEQQQASAFQEFRRAEFGKLRGAVPEWSDEAKFRAGLNEMGSYLAGLGMTRAEMDQIADHRHWLIIRDAMRFRALPTKQDAIKKKLRSVPKLVPPGTPRAPVDKTKKANEEAMSRLRKTGSREDARAAIMARLSGGGS